MGTLRRLAALGGAAVLLVGVGCGSDDDGDNADGGSTDVKTDVPGGFEASPGYLRKVVDETEGQTYRFAVDAQFSMLGDSFEIDDMMTGEFDGTREHMVMDMGAMMEEMAGAFSDGEDLPGGLTGDSMTMETIVDSDAMYLRAPFFATLGDAMAGSEDDLGSAGDLFGTFTQLDDKWGKVDLSKLGDVLPGEAASALGGGQTYDPSVFLEMIKSSDSVKELGTDEIDGVTVSGLSADVSMAEILESQNMSADDLGSDLDDLGDAGFPMEVWIDGDGLIRRIKFSFDESTLTDIAEASGEEVPADDLESLGSFGFGMTMDFSDYGDDSISVDVPGDDEVVDITDEFVEGYESLGEMSVDLNDLTES